VGELISRLDAKEDRDREKAADALAELDDADQHVGNSAGRSPGHAAIISTDSLGANKTTATFLPQGSAGSGPDSPACC
jgi:hypothetical protein